MKFGMHKIKQGKFTAGAGKSNFKRIIARFVANDNAFHYELSQRNTGILEAVFI